MVKPRVLDLLLVVFLVGCSDPTTPVAENDSPIFEDDDTGLFEAMLPPPSGQPHPPLPDVYLDLVPRQTAVKDQGRRGTCTAFTSAALMEAYYSASGQLGAPDFSEQYIYWATKVLTGFMAHQADSLLGPTLDTIRKFGAPAREAWPYDMRYWGPADQRGCSGQGLAGEATACFTDGDPPPSAQAADKYMLPRSQLISIADIKTHLFVDRLPVAVGAKVFHQAWNSSRSPLPINIDYYHHGYVLYPTHADMQQKAGGHAFLIVGWDDTLEVPILDGNGRPVFNPDGTPKKEKGFFVFKNSWGTKSFGVLNPNGAGYGYLSERYAADFMGVARVLVVPTSPGGGDGGGTLDGGLDLAPPDHGAPPDLAQRADIHCGGACRPTEYCSFPAASACGQGGTPGVCVAAASFCPGAVLPVCGCDGRTYANGCYANRSGVDALHDGACP